MAEIPGVTDQMSTEDVAALDAMRDDAPEPEIVAEPAAEPAEPAKAEPVVAAEPVADPAAKPVRMVSHEALHEEREQHRETKKQLAETMRVMTERFAMLAGRIGQNQAPAAPVAAPPAIPTLEEDPLGHVTATLHKIGMSVEQLQQATQQRTQYDQHTQAVQALGNRAAALESEFSAKTPDYTAASNHLRQSRDSELQAMGIADPMQRGKIMQDEALGIADRALREGKNPAEIVYGLAKIRGYQTPAPAAPEPAPAPAVPDNVTKLATIEAGQKQARSLSSARGGAPAPFTAEGILKMTEAEFAKHLENPEFLAQFG